MRGVRMGAAGVQQAPLLPWVRRFSEESSGDTSAPRAAAGRGAGGSGASKMRAHARPVQGKLFPERSGPMQHKSLRSPAQQQQQREQTQGQRPQREMRGAQGERSTQTPRDGSDSRGGGRGRGRGRGRDRGDRALAGGSGSGRRQRGDPEVPVDVEDLEDAPRRRKGLSFKSGKGIAFDQVTDPSADRRRGGKASSAFKSKRTRRPHFQETDDFLVRRDDMDEEVEAEASGLGDMFLRPSQNAGAAAAAGSGGGLFGAQEIKRDSVAEEGLITPVPKGGSAEDTRMSDAAYQELVERDMADFETRERHREELMKLMDDDSPDELLSSKRLEMFDEASLQNFQTDVTLFMKEITRNYTDMALAKFYNWHEAIMKIKDKRALKSRKLNQLRRSSIEKMRQANPDKVRYVPQTQLSINRHGFVTKESIYEEAKLQVQKERGYGPPAEFQDEIDRFLQGFGRNPTFSAKDKVYVMKKAITFFTDAPPKADKLVSQVEAARAAAWATAENMGEDGSPSAQQ